MHWKGTAWSSVPVPVTNDLNAVRGSSANDIWLTGDVGTLFHYDGAVWSSSPSGTFNAISDVWLVPGGTSKDIWAVGDLGTILRHQ